MFVLGGADLTVLSIVEERVCQLRQVDKHITAGAILNEILNHLNLFEGPNQPLVGTFSLWMVSRSPLFGGCCLL